MKDPATAVGAQPAAAKPGSPRRPAELLTVARPRKRRITPIDWLAKPAAADYLGVSTRTLERMVKDGLVRSSRLRGRVVFRREWLDAVIDGRKRG